MPIMTRTAKEELPSLQPSLLLHGSLRFRFLELQRPLASRGGRSACPHRNLKHFFSFFRMSSEQLSNFRPLEGVQCVQQGRQFLGSLEAIRVFSLDSQESRSPSRSGKCSASRLKGNPETLATRAKCKQQQKFITTSKGNFKKGKEGC